jgi:hypothetical protein
MITRYMHTTSKKALAVIVALAMLLAMAPMQAWEAFADSGKSGGNVIDMSDEDPAGSGTGWAYDEDSEVYMIQSGADVNVTGDNGTSQRRLEVATGAAVKITLKGVTIGAIIGYSFTLNEYNSPLKLNPGANVDLAIEGTDRLVAGDYQAGINVPEGTALSISGGGELTAIGGSSEMETGGAGIGGRHNENSGTITIYDGTVNVAIRTDNSGAGIGGGANGDGGNITIYGGTVNVIANGERGAGAGIGSGANGVGGMITISGGTVNVELGTDSMGAGIGSGYQGAGGDITISGGTVTVTSGYYIMGAGIGSGANGVGGKITISSGVVNVIGGYSCYGAGIGGGSGGDGGEITISGGVVNVKCGESSYGAGIGGGGYGGAGGDIIICGEAAVTATGGEGADDIGGGYKDRDEPDPGNQFIAANVNNDPTESYKVVGNPTLPAGLTANIPADQTMTVTSGSALTVKGTIDVYGELALENHNSEIDNQGTINIYGKLANDGTLNNKGSVTIEKDGKLTNDGTLNNKGSVTIEEGGEYTGNTPTGNPVKYAGADVSQPTVDGEPTETTISVNAVSLLSDTGQQIEYAISTEQTEPNDGWKDGTEFTGLTADTTYYVSARSKANDTYNVGKRSMSDPIATKTADTPDTPVTPVAPTTNATTATTAAKNVTAIRTPLKAIHMQRGTALTPPVCADSKDPVTKKPHITAKLTWSSSNPKIATVNAATGKIKAKKAGKAKITARALNGKKLTITVNVVKNATPLKTITLKKAPNSLKAGKARLLSVKTTPYQATNLKVTFSSSNRNILSVDKAGKITAKKKGKAKITIKVGAKKYVKTITVK